MKSVLVFMSIGLIYISLFKGLMTGYQFPKESELLYETGYLKSYSETGFYSSRGGTRKYLTPIIVLTKKQDSSNGESYHCNYDYGIDDKSYCFTESHLPKEYARQFAKIGYYQQPNFLWLKDNRRKLVTLQVNDKIIIDYETTKQKIQSQRRFTTIMGIFAMMLLFFVWFVDKKENHQ